MVRQHHQLNEHAAAAAKLLQSCLTLCDPTDGSLPGSSVPGILQAALGSPQINHISIYDIWAKSEITYLVKCFILLKKFTFGYGMFFCSTMVPTGNLGLLLSLLWMCYVAISLLLAPDPETRATSLSLPSPQIPGGWGGGTHPNYL